MGVFVGELEVKQLAIGILELIQASIGPTKVYDGDTPGPQPVDAGYLMASNSVILAASDLSDFIYEIDPQVIIDTMSYAHD